MLVTDKSIAYNPKRDVSEVDQFGFVNLHDVARTGVVPSDLAIRQELYNNIDDPRSILGKPSDRFEAMALSELYDKSKPE